MERPSAQGPNLATEVVAKHWHLDEPASRTHLGVSRVTWRIGPHYWLSQAEGTRMSEVHRHTRIAFELHRCLKDQRLSISVPEVVPSHAGNLVVQDGGYLWSLTRNIPGKHCDATDPVVYRELATGLATFHRALQLVAQNMRSDVHSGICARTRPRIARCMRRNFAPFSSDPQESTILHEAALWLTPRLDRLEQLPRQLIHGDWTPQNVLFEESHPANRLHGVLDLEAVAFDPVSVDVANICSTLLMWSGLDRLDIRIAGVLDAYCESSGVKLEIEDIHTAMVAHWFCHYWSWRDRLEVGEFGHEVKDRLCLRIRSALSYVTKLTPS